MGTSQEDITQEPLTERREIDRSHLTPDQRAYAIATEKFGRIRPDDKEIDNLPEIEEVKTGVRALFDAFESQEQRIKRPILPLSNVIPIRHGESSLNAQAKSYLEQLLTDDARGYEIAHLALTDGGLYVPNRDLAIPTQDEVMAVLAHLTPQELEILKRFLIEPGIAIEPIDVNWRKFKENMNEGTAPKYKAGISEKAELELDRQDRVLGVKGSEIITGWNVSIEETSREGIASFMGFLKKVMGSAWERSDAKANGLQLHTGASYMLTQKRAYLAAKQTGHIQGKELLDTDGFSLLQRADNGEVLCPDGFVLGGCDGWRELGLHRVSVKDYDYKTGHFAGTRIRPRMVLRAAQLVS